MAEIGFFPDYSDANPYQRELAESLEDKGHSIEMFDEDSSISRRTREEKLDGVHLHWLTPYIHGETTSETLFKTCSTAASLLLLRLNGYKIIWTAHNIESHDQGNLRIEKLFKLFCTKLLFDRIITHCISAKKKSRKSTEQVKSSSR